MRGSNNPPSLSSSGPTVPTKRQESPSFPAEGSAVRIDDRQSLVGDFPLYPGARLMAHHTAPTTVRPMLISPDVLATVLGFFQNRLRETGWPIEMTDEPGRGVLLCGAKGQRIYEILGRR